MLLVRHLLLCGWYLDHSVPPQVRQAFFKTAPGFLKSCFFIQNGTQARRSEEEGVAVGCAHRHTFLFP